ncbi:MAG: DMT family transporter [Pseudomonadota bacterium]
MGRMDQTDSIRQPGDPPQGPGHLASVTLLLVGAGLWGVFWYPLRWLDAAGLPGLWAVAAIYVGATVVGLVAARHHLRDFRRWPGRLTAIALTSGLSGTAFSLGMIEGHVVRVLLLFYLSPVWSVAMAHLLLGERLNATAGVALALALAGAVVMLLPGAESTPLGRADALGLLAGMAFATTNIQVRHAQAIPLRVKSLAAWAGAPFLAGGAAWAGGQGVPVEAGPWLVALAVGALMMTTMTVTVQVGVTWLPVQQSSVILLFELVAGAVSSALVAGEVIGVREALGGLLIVAGGLLSARPPPGEGP